LLASPAFAQSPSPVCCATDRLGCLYLAEEVGGTCPQPMPTGPTGLEQAADALQVLVPSPAPSRCAEITPQGPRYERRLARCIRRFWAAAVYRALPTVSPTPLPTRTTTPTPTRTAEITLMLRFP